GRSLGDEPLAYSQFTRSLSAEFAGKTAERVLAQGEPSLDALLTMQRLLQSEDDFPEYWHTTRGERAFYHETMVDIESGEISANPFTGLKPKPGEELLQPFWKSALKSDHANNLVFLMRFVEVTRLPFHEQAAAEATLNAEMKTTRRSLGDLDRMPAVSAWAERG